MIQSFRSKALKAYVDRGDRSKLSMPNLPRLETMLELLDEAVAAEEMAVPGWRFHALKSDRKGRFAISVSGNWRITFGWDGQNAVEVDLEDYH